MILEIFLHDKIQYILIINYTSNNAMQGFSHHSNFHLKDSINSLNNNPTSHKKNQEQPRKIFCAYHSNQFLTNFCIQKDCLMPLCPNCVVEHTEEHYQCNQKPSYLNLHEAIQGVKRKCFEHVTKLEEYDMRNDEIHNFLIGLPEYVQKQVGECRRRMHEHLDNCFDDYELKLIDEIREKYATEQVFQRRECTEVKEYIHNQIDILYQKIDKMKGQNCLSQLIKYHAVEENQLYSEMEAIDTYLEKNKKAGGLYIDLNLEKMEKLLQNCCQKIVQVQYLPHLENQLNELSSNGDYPSSGRKPMLFSSIVKRVSNALSRSEVKSKSKSKLGKSKLKNIRRKQSIVQIENDYYNSPFRGDF